MAIKLGVRSASATGTAGFSELASHASHKSESREDSKVGEGLRAWVAACIFERLPASSNYPRSQILPSTSHCLNQASCVREIPSLCAITH